MILRSRSAHALVVTAALLGLGCQSAPPEAGSGSLAASATAPVASAATSASGPPAREIAGASHILVAYKGAERAPAGATRTKESARRRAEEALQKVRKDKDRFADWVKEYSDDDASKPANGAIGNFERYAMPARFADATFALAVGEVSDVVETPRGFHIILRTK